MGCMVKTIDFSAAALDVLLGWSIDMASYAGGPISMGGALVAREHHRLRRW